jgi:hypothetical protein
MSTDLRRGGTPRRPGPAIRHPPHPVRETPDAPVPLAIDIALDVGALFDFG